MQRILAPDYSPGADEQNSDSWRASFRFGACIGTMNRDQAAAGALASWTAAVLCRFCALAPDSKAPEDWRTPKPGGAAFGSRKEPSEICACTASLSLRYMPVSGLEGSQRGPARINELTVQQFNASEC